MPAGVAHIPVLRTHAKVLQPVVEWVAVYVVDYHTVRNGAIVHLPNDAMGKAVCAARLLTVYKHRYWPPPSRSRFESGPFPGGSHMCSITARVLKALPSALLPNKVACAWIVIEYGSVIHALNIPICLHSCKVFFGYTVNGNRQ